ncbi:hypothetical protein, partial [uncultured Bradyrhizobium sp.]|uniref:hypothetical protein n=1 Tax=uncultured Bradyrhizobium sp. TaxID=199684 RepID=UPI0035CBB8C2
MTVDTEVPGLKVVSIGRKAWVASVFEARGAPTEFHRARVRASEENLTTSVEKSMARNILILGASYGSLL